MKTCMCPWFVQATPAPPCGSNKTQNSVSPPQTKLKELNLHPPFGFSSSEPVRNLLKGSVTPRSGAHSQISATVTGKAADFSCLPAQCFAAFLFFPDSFHTKCSRLSVRSWVLWSQELSPCSEQGELSMLKGLRTSIPTRKGRPLGIWERSSGKHVIF